MCPFATRDGTQSTPGLEMSQVLTAIQNSSVAEVIVILDCCFSGAAGQVPQLGSIGSLIRPGVSILAASRGDQTSAETLDGGAFTTSLVAGLDGGAADVVGKIHRGWPLRIPDRTLSVHGINDRRSKRMSIDSMIFDQCKPAVPLDELRRLTEFFPTFDHQFPLDPSYELMRSRKTPT